MDVSHLPADEFILDEHVHPLLKVAILHAQFESIHPFLDGNGRLGRIMIALYMMQSGQVSSPIFFVSEELDMTFQFPNITAAEVVKHANVAPTTARRALNSLVEKGLLFRDPSQKRNIEYFNYDVLELFDT